MNPIHEQISLFSCADPLLEEAETAMRAMRFEEAESLYQKAQSLDPWISNIESLLKICDFFKIQFGRGSEIASFLGSVWMSIPKAVDTDRLKDSEASIVETYIAHWADSFLPDSTAYMDREERIHRGNVLMKTRQFQNAQKHILESLTNGYTGRSDLWAYYGDACYSLNRAHEAQAAYIKALLLDPHRIDYFRMAHPEIKRQLSSLGEEMDERSAQALLLFKCWSAGCLSIPRRNSDDVEESDLIDRLINTEPADEQERLHLFSSCLYYDQIQPKDRIHIDLREKMKTLDPERFGIFLNILQARENQIPLF